MHAYIVIYYIVVYAHLEIHAIVRLSALLAAIPNFLELPDR
jgi:hypothetical protein